MGATISFFVAHLDAGPDGEYGTRDDLYTYDLSGTGETWTVTDGSDEDEDGAVNGTVVTTWYVNQDAANQTFIVYAADAASGESDSVSSSLVITTREGRASA